MTARGTMGHHRARREKVGSYEGRARQSIVREGRVVSRSERESWSSGPRSFALRLSGGDATPVSGQCQVDMADVTSGGRPEHRRSATSLRSTMRRGPRPSSRT